jgi:hypothetical protein
MISIVVMCAVAIPFYLYRVPVILYYLVMPLIGFASGYAFAWAYGVNDQDLMLVMAAATGLLGVQGAWVLTTRIPRP